MFAWISWSVLATTVVITQSLPREYNIPVVGNNARSQYYVLHDDGDFKYGYDTGVNTYESAVQMGDGDLTGFFGFKNPLGENIRVDYTAGVRGFLPRISGQSTPSAQASSFSGASASTYSAEAHAEAVALHARAHQELLAKLEAARAEAYASHASARRDHKTSQSTAVFKAAQALKTFENSDLEYVRNDDGSYSFSYRNSDSSRSESADADNNVVGRFTFVADGKTHEVNYRAGSGIGYVPESADLPVAPAATASEYSAPRAAYVDPLSSGLTHAEALRAHAAAEAVVKGFIPSIAGHSSSSDQTSSFSGASATTYSAEAHAEAVALHARAHQELLAKLEAARAEAYANHASARRGLKTSESTAVFKAAQALKVFENSDVEYTRNDDGSYSFSYRNSDSSRSESADADNNVVGRFTFVADGKTHEVNYRAGSGIGFVPEGADLPVAPAAAASEYSAPTAAYVDPLSSGLSHAEALRAHAAAEAVVKGFIPSIAGHSSASYQTSSFSGASATTYSAEAHAEAVALHARAHQELLAKLEAARAEAYASHASARRDHKTGQSTAVFKAAQALKTFENSDVNYVRNDDGSYSFSYTNSDSSRSESADADNNVVGRFTFVADGKTHEVNYRAGSGIGYVPEGADLPVAPAAAASEYSAPTAAYVDPLSSGLSHAEALRAHAAAEADVRGSIPSISGQSSSDPTSSFSGASATTYSAEAHAEAVALHARAHQELLAKLEAARAEAYASHASARRDQKTGQSTAVFKAAQALKTFENSDVDYVRNDDGSYSFSYTNSDSSRSESADAENNVVGRFTFVADGKTHEVNYRAGSGIGYVPEGADLPVAPAAAASEYSAPTAAYVDPLSSGLSHAEALRAHAAAEAVVRGSIPSISGHSFSDRASSFSGASATTYSAEAHAEAVALHARAHQELLAKLEAARAEAYANHASARRGQSTAVFNAAQALRTFENSDVDYIRNDDGSYSFSYTNSDSSRSESADADNNVVGRFTFVADGKTHEVNYRAGSGIGFVPEGADLPVADAAVTSEYSAPRAAFVDPQSSGLSHGEALRAHAAAESAVQSETSAHADNLHALANSVAQQSGYSGVRSYGADEEANTRYTLNADGSYTFAYENSDSSRSETADADNNVVGRFSFVSDGSNRNVNYRAGSGIGFVPDNVEVPESSGAAEQPSVYTAESFDEAQRKHAEALNAHASSVDAARASLSQAVASVQSENEGQRISYTSIPESSGAVVTAYTGGDANIISSGNVDGSYSFNYDNEDSHRSETADSDLNVRGEFGFVGDDGFSRRVTYIAGSDTGFVAEGDHLPGSAEAPAGSNRGSVSGYSASADTGFVSRGEGRGDASYTFSYNAPGSSRRESADADLNVRGEYSFVADDGKQRQINYIAGSETGFVAEGDLEPDFDAQVVEVAAPVTYFVPQRAAPAVTTLYVAPVAVPFINAPTAPVVSHQLAVHRSGASSAGRRQLAAYSFSYDNENSARAEDADDNLNVEGEFSFVADDGQLKKVNYVAGSATGFVAEGDHLPVAPVADESGSSGSDATASSASFSTFKSGTTSSFKSSGTSSGSHKVTSSTSSGTVPMNPKFYSAIVGDVRVNKYVAPSKKYGYVFTQV